MSAAFLKRLQARCKQSCLLDPGDPRLLEDWLDLRVLAARRLLYLQINNKIRAERKSMARPESPRSRQQVRGIAPTMGF